MLPSKYFLVLAFTLLACGGSNADLAAFDEPADTGVAADTKLPSTGLGSACTVSGARSCLDSKQQLICDGAKWTANGTCNGDQVCDTRAGATLGTCVSPVCKPGSFTCEGSTLRACTPDGLAYKTSTCTSEEHCKQAVGGLCAKCLAWEVRCDGAKLLKCAPDRQRMIELATCESPGLCSDSTGACLKPVCSFNEFRCLGDLLEKCNDDRTGFDTVKKCAEGMCDAPARSCRG